MPPKTLPLVESYNITVERNYFDGTLASTHPSEDGAVANLMDLLNVTVRPGATTLFPYGEEEIGNEHNVSLVMAQMELFQVFSNVRLDCSRKGNLFLEYRCPNQGCPGAVIFQLVANGEFNEPVDKRFGKCIFRQGVEHELNCNNSMPSPETPMRFGDMPRIMQHVVAIRAAVRIFGAEFSENLGRNVVDYLVRTHSRTWTFTFTDKQQVKRILAEDGSYFRRDKKGKLDSLNLTTCCSFNFIHMTVGKNLYSKRPSAAVSNEFTIFDQLYPNLTFQSRHTSNMEVCLYCTCRLGEDFDESAVVPRIHGNHVAIVVKCTNPLCKDHVFHLSCFVEYADERDLKMYRLFPTLFQMYRTSQPAFNNNDAIGGELRGGLPLLFRWNCPLDSHCGLKTIIVVDRHGLSARSFGPPPQTMKYLSKDVPVPRTGGPAGSHLLKNGSNRETEKYHWTTAFGEGKKRAGLLNSLVAVGNELVDEGGEQVSFASVQLADYPMAFPRNFIRPQNLLIVDPTDRYEYRGDEEDYSNDLYFVDMSDPFPAFVPVYGSGANPIQL